MRTSLKGLALCAALAAVLGPANLAHASDCSPLYTYRATVTDVYDGDTVTADIDLGFRMWVRGERLRLHGIDAPEVRGAQKTAGLESRDALKERILGKTVVLCTIKDKKGKFGRYLATIFVDDLNVNEWLVSNGYAERRTY